MSSLDTDWRKSFTKEEITELREHSDWQGWLMLTTDYAVIAAAMALVALYPNPFAVILALLVIGTRQLGLAIVFHEAAHRTLFNDRELNDWAGNWLAAYPIYLSADMYRHHDGQQLAFALVAHRDGVAPAGAVPGHREQQQAATREAVERRAKQRPDQRRQLREEGVQGHCECATSSAVVVILSPLRSSPVAWTAPSTESRYEGPSAVGTNQPVGHMVRISTNEKPRPSSCASQARRSIFFVRVMAAASWTEPRAA